MQITMNLSPSSYGGIGSTGSTDQTGATGGISGISGISGTGGTGGTSGTGTTGGLGGLGGSGGLTLQSPMIQDLLRLFKSLVDGLLGGSQTQPQPGQGTESPQSGTGSGTPAPGSSTPTSGSGSGTPTSGSGSGTPTSGSGTPTTPTSGTGSADDGTHGVKAGDPTYQKLAKDVGDATDLSNKIANNPGTATMADVQASAEKNKEVSAELQNTPVEELRANRTDIKKKMDDFASSADAAEAAVKKQTGIGSSETSTMALADADANAGRGLTLQRWKNTNDQEGVVPPKDGS